MSPDKTMNVTSLEAAIFFDSHLPEALRQALDYAGDDGFVASMPQLLHARTNAPFDNEIWDTWFFTSNSEESMVRTPQGNHVAVLVHGGGIFATPARFRKLYLASTNRHSKNGFTGLFGGRILDTEARDILDGRCPDGSELPSKCGLASFDELKNDPLMIVRAGGVAAASAYLDKAKEYYGTTEMGSWHRFDDMDPMNPQTWVPFVYDCLGGASKKDESDLSMRTEGMMDIWVTHYRIARDAGFGIRADTALINTARYVAVAPRDDSTGVRDLAFNA
jgi:hypothetical protein